MAKKEVRQWFTLYVRSRSEKKVLTQIEDLGIEVYLPLITLVKQWSDRKKRVEEPLFKSYIFVKATEKERLQTLNVFGAVRYVSFERIPAVVPENQIMAIKKYVAEYEGYDYSSPSNDTELKKGQRVRIMEGHLKGLEGHLVLVNDKRRMVVHIDSVGQSIIISIPRTKIEPINERDNKIDPT